MKKEDDNKEKKSSFLQDEIKAVDAREPLQTKIVIPDECGDSLWDEVLAQYTKDGLRVKSADDDQDLSKQK